MKIKLIGKNLQDILPILSQYPCELVDDAPDVVVAHGGDGTLLMAERAYPGIPKLPLRDAGTAPQCEEHHYADVLDLFFAGMLKQSILPKLECCHEGRELLAVNDIFIHNLERMNALRYRVWINDELYANEVVGDAVGLSSVHGSTAYYKSITHSIFRCGIGLSFSNSTEEVNHLVLPADSLVRIAIVRGPGLIIADNDRDTLTVQEGEMVSLRESDRKAFVYGLSEFMCPKCRILRHPNKSPYQGYIAP